MKNDISSTKHKEKTVSITTLGCKVNQLESASFTAAFANNKIRIVNERESADIVVINTCAVTETASAQSRRKIRRLLRNNPRAKFYITGCYVEEVQNLLWEIEEIEQHGIERVFLFGNNHKDKLPLAAINSELYMDKESLGNISTAKEICRLPIAQFSGRTRAYLRIQDGCEAFCSYCIVPYTRGPSRSLPPKEVLEQAHLLAKNHPELVLTGIHLGYYGADLSPSISLSTLLEKLLKELPHIRFRISSLEPVEIDDHLLELFSLPNLMPHLHIPLQSGCDKILQAMNRRYTTSEFRNIIEKCHQIIPHLAVGIDILAGFPGENDEDFHSAFNFLKDLDFCYLHVFPYSRRPGTAAATMDNQVSDNKKEQRVQQLLQLSQQKRTTFYTANLETTRTVLFEGKRDNEGLLKGFSDNYLDVRAPGDDTLLKKTASVKLQTLKNGVLLGTVETGEK